MAPDVSPPAPAEPLLRIQVFGAVEITGSAAATRILSQPKLTSLLGYLCLARPAGLQRRDRIIGLFWPEQPAERARGSLRTALHAMREALGADVFVRRGDGEVGLDFTRVWCDAHAFLEAIEEGRLARALELYRGPALEGLYGDSTPLDHWLEEEREHYRALAADAAWGLAEQYGSGSDLTMAGKWARRAARLARADERRIRRVMSLLEKSGDRTGAIAVYEDFVRYAARELNVEPSQETRDLAERIRQG
jgi:DNA-binding SARP family transcriptional activator